MRRLMLLIMMMAFMVTGLTSCARMSDMYVSSRDTMKGWFGGDGDNEDSAVTAAPAMEASRDVEMNSSGSDLQEEVEQSAEPEAGQPDTGSAVPVLEVSPLAANERTAKEAPAEAEETVAAAAPSQEIAPELEESAPVPVVTSSPPRAVVRPVGTGHSRWSDTAIWW